MEKDRIKMENKPIMITAIIFILISTILLSFFYYLQMPELEIPSGIPKENTIYLEKECTPSLCEKNSFQPIDVESSINKGNLNARVFGTLYADNDIAVVFGTCSDNENKPTGTNASVTIYFQNTSIYINNSNMTTIDVGRFNFSTNITSNRGNYLVMLNCTQGSKHAVAYAEFQNPSWINNILNSLNTITGKLDKTDFNIDKLTAVSPIYPNETIFIEATFSDENGTIITPSDINLSVFYPNRTLFFNKTKTHFSQEGYVWNYSEVTLANQKTGTYYVRLWANNSINRQAIQTAQFRIATGGPYRVTLSCPSAVEVGDTLNCIVSLTDEGEVPTESTTTIWIDTNGDLFLDVNEPQASFSKETSPLQVLTEPANINIPLSHSTGVFIVRLKTSYLGSTQPDSTASSTVTLLTRTILPSAGASAGGSKLNCNTFIISNNYCYYLNNNTACVRGCPISTICQNLMCTSSNETTILKVEVLKPKISFLMGIWLKLKGLFKTESPDVIITSQKQESSPSLEQTSWIQENIYIIFGIVLMILLIMAIFTFGMSIFTNPTSLALMGFMMMISFVIIYYRVFG